MLGLRYDKTPTVVSDSDTAAVELGMKFRADQDGFVSGVRFYKGSANTGTHTGSLWKADGTQLATVTFTGESASGWQVATFATPVSISANTTYIDLLLRPEGALLRRHELLHRSDRQRTAHRAGGRH